MPRKYVRVADRAARAGDARNFQSRKAEMRDMINAEERGILWFPKEIVPPGMVYGWIRVSCLGQIDQLNMTERQQGGWKPVPSDRHPDMVMSAWGIPGVASHSMIERAGLFLCELPEHTFKRRADLQRLMAAEAQNIKHIEGDPNAKALPVFDESSDIMFEQVYDPRVTGTGRRPEQEFKE